MNDGYKEEAVDDTDLMQLLALPENEPMNKPWDRFFLLGEEKELPC